jgi:hypothetical protein
MEHVAVAVAQQNGSHLLGIVCTQVVHLADCNGIRFLPRHLICSKLIIVLGSVTNEAAQLRDGSRKAFVASIDLEIRHTLVVGHARVQGEAAVGIAVRKIAGSRLHVVA